MVKFRGFKQRFAEEYKKQQAVTAARKAERASQLALKKAKRAKQLELQKAEQARQLAVEEARREKILAGQLDPITVSVNLRPDEKAYLELTARRMALVDRIVEETTGNSKKKHVVGRALVGGVLLGPLGAVGGAATAGSKNKSVTTQKTLSSVQLVDSGPMLLTNQRFIFIGNNSVVSLPYEEIVAVSFDGDQITVKYPSMLQGEHYKIFGTEAKEAQLYYRGITQQRLTV